MHRRVVLPDEPRDPRADLARDLTAHPVPAPGDDLDLGARAAARRQDTVVLNAFHTAARTASDVDGEDTLGAPRYLVTAIADQLRRARAGAATSDHAADHAADQDADPDADLDAELIVAAASGLAQTLLVDRTADARVDRLLDRLLDRLVAPRTDYRLE